jgi:hypothetical protein
MGRVPPWTVSQCLAWYESHINGKESRSRSQAFALRGSLSDDFQDERRHHHGRRIPLSFVEFLNERVGI